MKIDNGQTNFDPQAASITKGGATAPRSQAVKAEAGRAAGPDKVSVSQAAQFASAAIDASQQSPDVRPDVVARAKQLLNDGKVGNDPHRLADALIDHAIDESN